MTESRASQPREGQVQRPGGRGTGEGPMWLQRAREEKQQMADGGGCQIFMALHTLLQLAGARLPGTRP